MIKKIVNPKSKIEKEIPDQVRNDSRGFTLIELITVIAIFGILTSVIVFNYGKFTGDTVLTNMAYELALSIREAQTFGVAVRKLDGGVGTSDFEHPYGINLNIENGDNPDYILYIDSNDNGQCDGDSGNCDCSGDECVQRFTMQRGMVVSGLKSGCNNPVDVLNLAFKRPNPEPISNGVYNIDSEVELKSPQGSTRYVITTSVGQVYVSNNPVCS